MTLRSRLACLGFAGLAVAAATACSLTPANGQFECTNAALDCPPGWVCYTVAMGGNGRCYSEASQYPDLGTNPKADTTSATDDDPGHTGATGQLTDPPTDNGPDTETATTDTGNDKQPGSTCAKAIPVSADGFVWQGNFGAASNTFVPTNTCGSGDKDLWFALSVPKGQTAWAQAESNPDVTVRFVADCASSGPCLSYDTKNKRLEWTNVSLTTQTVYIIVSRQSENTNTVQLQAGSRP